MIFVPNEDQAKAADMFLKFLIGPDKEMTLYGPGGVGKSATVAYFVNEVMERYKADCNAIGLDPIYRNYALTAMTNKAAEALNQATGLPVSTIHSFLKLTIRNDFTSGEQKLIRTKAWAPIENTLVILDEAFMADSALVQELKNTTINCKFLYVGDELQLEPVKEAFSPITMVRTNHAARLSIPMRTSHKPLQDLNEQMREIVRSGIHPESRLALQNNVFTPIKEVPGFIEVIDKFQLKHLLETEFKNLDTNHRIVAYTNARVNDYNAFIRKVRGFDKFLQVGEYLICNEMHRVGDFQISTEQQVEVTEVDDFLSEYVLDEIKIPYQRIRTGHRGTSYSPDLKVIFDRDHYDRTLKYLAKRARDRLENWERFYRVKEGFIDLRPRDASTVHKLQGSSCDVILVDLENIGTCHVPNTTARLLYVALSRARHKVLLYGSLPKAFGGPVIR